MKSSVLLVGNFLSATGASRGVCEELAVRLQQAGSSVITTSAKVPKLARLFDMLRTAWATRRSYAVAHVDVYSGSAFIWAEVVSALLRMMGKPLVLTLHGGNLPRFAATREPRVRRLLRSAMVVTTPSRYLLEQMSGYREDLRLLPNALEVTRCSFRLRVPARPALLWLRAFHQIYNPSLAVDVLSRIAVDHDEAQLTMVGPDKGDGSFGGTKRRAVKLGVFDRLCLPGAVSKLEVPRWLNAGDIFLNTANVDNTPVSVLEAMACGLCVVSTRVGGLPYLLENERDALLVAPNDPEAMSAAVNRLLMERGLAEALSRNARYKAEKHDWSKVLPEWIDLFHWAATTQKS